MRVFASSVRFHDLRGSVLHRIDMDEVAGFKSGQASGALWGRVPWDMPGCQMVASPLRAKAGYSRIWQGAPGIGVPKTLHLTRNLVVC